MRWFPLKEGYQKKIVWVNVDHVTTVKFASGADGMPMAYMTLSTGSEVTTHDKDDLDKLQRILEKNTC